MAGYALASPLVANPPRARFLHKGDAERIHTDQQRETADGNSQIDLIHGDLSGMAHSMFVVHESRFVTRSLLSDPSHNHGSSTVRTVMRSE